MNIPGGSSQVADNVGLLTYMHLVPDNGQVAGEAGLSSSLDSGVSVGLAELPIEVALFQLRRKSSRSISRCGEKCLECRSD